MAGLRDRHMLGVGAAACAVCCAVPLAALLGIAGAAATVFTLVFAGATFALVVATATLLAMTRSRRRDHHGSTDGAGSPVDLDLSHPPHHNHDRSHNGS